MYLLFLDESGTHGNAKVFVLAGIALHERDAPHFARRIERDLTYRLAPAGLDASNFELHATRVKAGHEEWVVVPPALRATILGSTYRAIATYGCLDQRYPYSLIGAVVDRRLGDFENRAYELVLNKFDDLLDRRSRRGRDRQNGLVIHDRRVVNTVASGAPAGTSVSVERLIQEWTRNWQEVAGRVGQLHNFAEVPLFADSRASRLVQVADFTCWGLWRYYSRRHRDERWIRSLWTHFGTGEGTMPHLIHVSPDYATKKCKCPPCTSRLIVA